MNLKLYNIGCVSLLAVATLSCSDYLKEDSGDLLIPEKVSEYQAVLNGEGYPKTFTDDVAFTDLMTDNVTVMDGQTTDPDYAGSYDEYNLSTGRGAYLWARDMEYYLTDLSSAYENRYKNILACNTIIENEETMIGTDSERNFCVAQAYTLRAFNYFCLVNLYGLPYNKSTASTDMGVAIRLESKVTREEFVRSTVQEVYDQINSDLDKALELFDKTSEDMNIFQISKRATQLLKCRVALYTENWSDAIKYGEAIYNDGISLENIGKLTADEMKSGSTSSSYSFISETNPEVIFTFGDDPYGPHNYMTTFIAYMDGPAFVTSQTGSDDLLNIYEEGDNRIYAFFWQDVTNSDGSVEKHLHLPYKYYVYGAGNCYKQAFRTAEVLLNLAEAYARSGESGNESKAIDMLNELRQSRFTSEAYVAKTAADFASTDELLKFTWQERRRELCFDEMHRWFDLRREGMPRIEHKYHASNNAVEQTYVLEEKDQNYTLALPKSETTYNSKIEVYNRRDIKAQ